MLRGAELEREEPRWLEEPEEVPKVHAHKSCPPNRLVHERGLWRGPAFWGPAAAGKYLSLVKGKVTVSDGSVTAHHRL